LDIIEDNVLTIGLRKPRYGILYVRYDTGVADKRPTFGGPAAVELEAERSYSNKVVRSSLPLFVTTDPGRLPLRLVVEELKEEVVGRVSDLDRERLIRIGRLDITEELYNEKTIYSLISGRFE